MKAPPEIPERTKKLSRQYKRYLGADTAEIDIAAIALALRAGESVDPNSGLIERLENFPRFVDTIEKSYAEYEERLKIATRNIEISSKELTNAYQRLENLNININAMLDSLGQGLLFFDKDGICSSVYSKSSLDILGTDPSNKPLPEVLDFNEKNRQTFQSWLRIVFSGDSALEFNDLKGLLPQEIIKAKGRIIELDYRPMYLSENKLMGILLIAEDVTRQREDAEKLAESMANAFKIEQVAQNRNGFYTFMTDLCSFIDMVKARYVQKTDHDDRDMLLRALHTYKGLAATFSLKTLSEALHRIELKLSRLEKAEFVSVLVRELGTIETIIEQEKAFARSLFGPDFFTAGRVKTIEVAKIEALAALFTEKTPDAAEITRFINHQILSTPIFDAFLPFERELYRLAEQQGKAIPQYRIQGDNVLILPAPYEKLFGNLIHLARNIVDHGLEMPDERIGKGKSRAGSVIVNIKQTNEKQHGLNITISDDGNGIDLDYIRQKLAEEHQIDTTGQSDEDIISYIFRPGFSLKPNISMISGRGMGMNALHEAVNEMGGDIQVISNYKDSQGTTFIFYLPLKI